MNQTTKEREESSLSQTYKSIGTALTSIDFKDIHGVSGVLFLFLCLKASYFFFSNNAKMNSANTDISINIVSLIMVFGLFDPKTWKKIQYEARIKQRFFLRLGSFNVAYTGLMMSYYTKVSLNDSITTEKLIGSILCLVGLVISSIAATIDVMEGTILKGTITASLTSAVFILVLPTWHLLIGTEELANLYEEYPMAEGVYIFSLITSFLNACDSFMAGLAWSDRLTFEQYHLSGVVIWAVFYNSLVVMAFGWLADGPFVSLVYFFMSSLMYFACSRVEKVILQQGKSVGRYTS